MPEDVTKTRRLVEDLRQQIIDGTLAPGVLLPTRAELAAHYQVSETTARNALKQLINEGLVVSRTGSGHRVRERPPMVRLARDRYHRNKPPFATEMRTQGRAPQVEWDSQRVPAPPAIAERLRIDVGEQVMRTAYVMRADGEVEQLSTSYEPLSITLGKGIELPEAGQFRGLGVIARMGAIGIHVSEVVESPYARPPLAWEAERLGLAPGVWVMEIERTHWAGDRPVETADIVLAADRYRPVYRIALTD
ncbi:GntR family transcriptional regulator [Microtetraspora sp. AC03309]|uniref:GntR family transcriptional regulator n=1 Tax=Microtetraspora sp. AC03309 TaxID=2779376 RepID=UPI001E5E3BBF|nr:GntR family transcriptional regulator [Microtetraspora sp. AC03309]MCC5574437.1 GntR family transcriptional regulator [Microtetraspora sp. AC03309]